MPISLPYLASSGTVDTALGAIKKAARPSKFTTDFVNTVLHMKGGTGAGISPFLKKLGFVNADGTPTALYDKFRNDGTSRHAVGEAIRNGYRPLYEANEYAHDLNDADLKGLILQVTGLEKGNRVAQLIFGTFKKLREHAEFGAMPEGEEAPEAVMPGQVPLDGMAEARGFNLAYTINLNLPASTNPEVFNAIFRSLKEHLLND